MSYKQRRQAEFNKCRTAANGQTCALLRDKLKLRFDLQPAGPKAFRAVQEQWVPLTRNEHSDHWDWEEISRAYNGLGDQGLALWAGEKLDQLAALAVARVSGSALCWDYLEGHPSGLLRPERFAIILDAYVRYARMCNLTEIRIEPLTETLSKRYISVYKFAPHPAEPCLRLELK